MQYGMKSSPSGMCVPTPEYVNVRTRFTPEKLSGSDCDDDDDDDNPRDWCFGTDPWLIICPNDG